jgi:hypothetical protein
MGLDSNIDELESLVTIHTKWLDMPVFGTFDSFLRCFYRTAIADREQYLDWL